MRSFFTLLLLGYTLGHNWIASESRVPFAATTFPCMNRRTSLPHIQIHPDQRFQVEWAIGHEADVYLTLIRAEDADKLVRHSRGNLDRYINGGFNQLPGNSRYKKLRRTPDNVNAGGLTLIGQGHPQFLDRPDEFGRTNEGSFDGEGFLWDYPYNNKDAVVSYESNQYPWIMAVWRYEIELGDARQIDTAEFWLADPSGQKLVGDYILHYSWRGYYDCMDINVIDIGSFVPFPYGQVVKPEDDPYGNLSFVSRRVDHCIFRGVEGMTGTPRKIYGAHGEQSCVNWCIDRYGFGCGGVNVHPFNLGRRAFPHIRDWDPTDNWILKMVNDSFYVERYPFTHYELGQRFKNTDQDDYVPGVDMTRDDLRMIFENAANQEDFLACFPLHPRQISTTEDKYVITDDPEDPVFFSTCYEVVQVRIFIGFNVSTDTFVQRHDFRAFDRCIDCVQREVNSRDQVPEWNVLPSKSPQCRNCDREPPTNVPASFPDEPVIIGGTCYEDNILGGHNPLSECVYSFTANRWIDALGHGTYEGMGPEGCGALVADWADCGPIWWYTYWDYPNPGLCACLRSNLYADCSDCQLTARDDGAVYSKDPSMGPGNGDPTCANGVLDDVNNPTYCCSSGCTDCSPTRTWTAGGRVCYAAGIPTKRTCDQYSAPCIMS